MLVVRARQYFAQIPQPQYVPGQHCAASGALRHGAPALIHAFEEVEPIASKTLHIIALIETFIITISLICVTWKKLIIVTCFIHASV